jgi:CBS domain-containing protein
MKVANILQSKGGDVYAIAESETLAGAASILAEKNIGALVVKNARGDVSGIISERDIVRKLSVDGAAALGAPVAACMTKRPFTCGLDDTLDDLMNVMTARRIRHLPVVDKGALVGLVSIGDVVKRKIDSAEQEARALREYISQ